MIKRYLPSLFSRNPRSSPELTPETVDSLRVLFDILDTKRTGRVSYETLCSRFGSLPGPHLPPSFLNCVGKVTPANGYLSFERFLAAVRLSLREREVNNNNLYRVQSEGKINQLSDNRKMSYSSMGLNDRRSQIYSSQPSVDRIQYKPAPVQYSSPPAYSEYAALNGENNNKVVMRPKKVTVRSQKEESRMRHPVPPNPNGVPPPRVQVVRSRPQSTASYNSIASSGMENINWRNSSISSSTGDSQKRNTIHEEENLSRVAKLGGIHKEEEELIKKGQEMAAKLSEWYSERLESLDKRSRLLNQRMVTLDSAVHEQRLNFLRAHLSELNRRIVSLMETSDKGFPSHSNLQKTSLPQPQDDQLTWLHRQNRMLNQELGDKTRQIEERKKDKENFDRAQSVNRIQPTRPVSAVTTQPSAFVRPAFQQPVMHHVSASPVKVYDTLM